MVGADVVASIDTWHDHEALRELVTLAVVDRPGVADGRSTAGLALRCAWPAHRSTSPARSCGRRSSRGTPVEGLVPDAVIRCIAERGLYAKGR